MGQILPGSATTTDAVRRAIQHSQESLRSPAKRYGVDPKTIAKWRARTSENIWEDFHWAHLMTAFAKPSRHFGPRLGTGAKSAVKFDGVAGQSSRQASKGPIIESLNQR